MSDDKDSARPHTLQVGANKAEPIHVLLVEDSPSDEALVRLLLSKSRSEFELSSVGRLSAALQHIASHDVDVVLLDLGLPDARNLDALTHILSLEDDLEVVVLTALDDSDLASEALLSGAIDYLVKGVFGSFELMRALRYAAAKKTSSAAQARVRQADRLTALGQLTARIAHEINNPATYVSANIELMRDDVEALESLLATPQPDHEVVKERLECILEAIDDAASGIVRIRRLASEVTSFSRFGAAPIVAVPMKQVLETCVQQTSIYVAERADLRADLRCEDFTIDGDAFRLEQVFTNLLRNAADACESDSTKRGTIHLSLDDSDPHWISVTVADDGIGIPEESLPHIFEPFYTSKARGTGLGLSLVVEIIRVHSGYIEVESTPGVGTTLKVFLPRSGAAVQPPAHPWVH